jgi:hypothetical protein
MKVNSEIARVELCYYTIRVVRIKYATLSRGGLLLFFTIILNGSTRNTVY